MLEKTETRILGESLTATESLSAIATESPEQFGSKPRWFARGMAVGLLAMASLNSLSYFVRSEHWGSLIGQSHGPGEAIGFPFKIWETGNMYGGYFADYPMIGLNVLVGVVLSLPIAILLAAHADWLNKLLFDSFAELDLLGGSDASSQPIQFSLLSMMVATTIAAIIAMIARLFAARVETLLAIDALGPLVLVSIAMLPRHLSWQQRVGIIAPAALILIAVAIAVGHALSIEFDKVLMGIFLCWTPQSGIAAIVIGIVALVQMSRQQSDRDAAEPPKSDTGPGETNHTV